MTIRRKSTRLASKEYRGRGTYLLEFLTPFQTAVGFCDYILRLSDHIEAVAVIQ